MMKLLNRNPQEINADVIKSMINDSTWSDQGKSKVYKFENGRDLWVNGNNHLTYILNSTRGRARIKLGNFGSYFIEFVNDFTLYFYNDKEKFVLKPESI